MNSAAPLTSQRIRQLNMKAGGGGTLLVLLIVGALVATWNWVIALILLFVLIGGFMATNRSWVCGNCRNPLASGAVSVCPACKAELS